MKYEYSKLPDKIFTPPTFKDINKADDYVIYLVNQIKSLQAGGEYARAANLVDKNYDVLKDYYLDANIINAISEEIMALEYYASDTKQSIYCTSEEPMANMVGDVWISSEDL